MCIRDREGYYCFHAGTKFKDGQIVTNGGRVVGITATGSNLKEARKNAYAATAVSYTHLIAKRVTVNGVNSNTEIGFTSRFKRDFDHAHILCYYKESTKLTLLITE